MSDVVIKISGMKLYRGERKALDIYNLTIQAGEHVAIIGPNGAGKSTLLQVVNTLIPWQAGQMELFGQAATEANSRQLRSQCSMVFQEALLLSNTVYENVALPLKLRGITSSLIRQKVEQAMEAFQCKHLAGRYARNLSGGEAQRVCLARALVYQPELLLLDEPFAALDPATRISILADLKEVTARMKMTVLLVSHNFQDVLLFADRTIVLIDGKIMQDDKPERVLRSPVNQVVATLVGMDNILPCRVELQEQGMFVKLTDSIFFAKNDIGIAAATVCCIPGDALTIWDDVNNDTSSVVVDGMVTQIVPGIGIYQVGVLAAGLSLTLRVPREKASVLAPGNYVKIAIDSSEVHVV